jgi:prolyl-tRNA synthetase
MGCYGIGVNRTIATVIEQNNDEKGIIWPLSVAPFHIHLIGLSKTDEEIRMADEIYSDVINSGLEVLYDDRKASPGFKFADADLVGIPVRVTVGKNYYSNKEIEIKLRSSKDKQDIKKLSREKFIMFLKDLKNLTDNEAVSAAELYEKLG